MYRVATGNAFDPATVNFMFSDADLIQEYGLMSPIGILGFLCLLGLLLNALLRWWVCWVCRGGRGLGELLGCPRTSEDC